jgi:RsiW-degrading membrane proteinase PrsW (M82 family)
VGSEYIGPIPDPQTTPPQHTIPDSTHNDLPPQEPAYREHVTGGLVFHPANAPYQGYPAGYPPYQIPAGYYPPTTNYHYGNNPAPYGSYLPPAPHPGYYPYPYYYPYPAQPPKPKRDGYLLGVSIAAFIGSILVLLGGFISFFILLLVTLLPTTEHLSPQQLFSSNVLFTALGIAGVLGGTFSLYHSIRSLFLRKPSATFKLPWFWVFLALYSGVLIIAGIMQGTGNAVSNIPLTIFLIALASLLPALTILSLGLRRIHFPRTAPWPTSWRRFTLALVSGTTLAIVLASIFELLLAAVLANSLGLTNIAIDNPNLPIPHNPRAIGFLFVLVAVIAPLVEETVKPLAVVILIGRIRSAAEAFILGLSCGIGFDLIETSSYISMGYKNWLDVALQRSTAGLLHGLGAAMVALGWYYLTHPKEQKHSVLLALGCWTYAVLQHAIWNGSFVLQLLPAPIGPYLDNGTINIGSLVLPSFILIYIVESTLILVFFLYMTGKLRSKTPSALSSGNTPGSETTQPAGKATARDAIRGMVVGAGRPWGPYPLTKQLAKPV